MKKLILLILTLLLSLKSFSQQDTIIDSIVSIKVPIARLVIIDLIDGDGAKEELVEVNDLLELEKNKTELRTKEIEILNTKITNLEKNDILQAGQLNTASELSEELHKELKAEKRKSFFYKVGTGVGIVLTAILLLR
tara:strand:+ start:1994 stop:2404 length:411 start_codon:yes stop_codon:yes gene_type:complete